MKNGQKPAEPRMEDVLASIRRAIDENAQGQPQDRRGGPLPDFRVKFEPAVRPEPPRRHPPDYSSPPVISQPPQGFAGILSGKRNYGEPSVREIYRVEEPVLRRVEPVVTPPAAEDDDRYSYDNYYSAPLEDYPETPPEPEAYQPLQPEDPPRYLPPAPAVIPDHRQGFAEADGLMSEESSEATQAAFNRLAETVTRRALGDRPIADVAQELLRGMLKQWLDENLPKIVEQLVREEIERVVRRPQR